MRWPSRRPCAVTRGSSAKTKRHGGIVALLHDFDYEQYPDLKDHPFRGAEILRERGCPEFVIRAILSHGEHTNTPRESRLEHTLFACDEMAGFVTAAALVRPSKSVRDLEPASVMKRMKDKAFAKGVSRDDLGRGAEELGFPLDEHISECHRLHEGTRAMCLDSEDRAQALCHQPSPLRGSARRPASP